MKFYKYANQPLKKKLTNEHKKYLVEKSVDVNTSTPITLECHSISYVDITHILDLAFEGGDFTNIAEFLMTKILNSDSFPPIDSGAYIFTADDLITLVKEYLLVDKKEHKMFRSCKTELIKILAKLRAEKIYIYYTPED